MNELSYVFELQVQIIDSEFQSHDSENTTLKISTKIQSD